MMRERSMLKKYLNYMINRNSNIITITITILTLFWTFEVMGYSETVYSGIRKIEISKNRHLEIEPYFAQKCNRENDLCLPSNRLFLVTDTIKHDFSNFISVWNNYTFVYFVKISKDKYLDDLDHDGNFEFALYPMVAGNNPITDAYLYSVVGNKVIHYGMGRFHFEWGPYVKEIIKGKWIEPYK